VIETFHDVGTFSYMSGGANGSGRFTLLTSAHVCFENNYGSFLASNLDFGYRICFVMPNVYYVAQEINHIFCYS